MQMSGRVYGSKIQTLLFGSDTINWVAKYDLHWNNWNSCRKWKFLVI